MYIMTGQPPPSRIVSSMDAITHTGPTCPRLFTNFLNLPLELRNKIWRLACPDSRVVPVFFHGHLAYKVKDILRKVKAKPLLLLSTCHESRRETQTMYRLCFQDTDMFEPVPIPLDMSSDIVLLYTKPDLFTPSADGGHGRWGKSLLWEKHLQRFMRNLPPLERAEIQHMAIDSFQPPGALHRSESMERPRQPRNLSLMPNLKTLSIVSHSELSHPATVDGFAVQQPDNAEMDLRGPVELVAIPRPASDDGDADPGWPELNGPVWNSGVRFRYVYLRDLGKARLAGYSELVRSCAGDHLFGRLFGPGCSE